MADLTPELLAQLSKEADMWPLGPHPRDEIAALASSEMLHAVPALVAAAKERDQLREAVRLREHATLEAWSGSLVGLDAAEAASAQAEALVEVKSLELEVDRMRRLANEAIDNAFAAGTASEALATQVAKLTDEVARLRKLGLDALEWGTTCSPVFREHARILAELERKP